MPAAARCRHDIPDSYQPIVHKVQTEFMLMGAVSFIVVLVEGIVPISVRPDNMRSPAARDFSAAHTRRAVPCPRLAA